MPRRALTICSVPGCPTPTERGRCDTHRREADKARGTSRQRGYGTRHRHVFRAAVLARDPVCVCPGCASCSTPSTGCTRASVHADHWPTDRRELVATGRDPDDPQYGRGLCHRCHSAHSAREQPGGWNS